MSQPLFNTTDLFDIIINDTKSTDIVLQGGTASGKTYAALQAIFFWSMRYPELISTVVGQDIPNLKKGALRDALRIINTSPNFKRHITDYNKSERIITLDNGSIIEFSSYADEQDAKSGKRNVLFVNEANGIDYDLVWQLKIRANMAPFSKRIYDYNPTATFWAHDKLIGKPGVALYITDHRHNPFLSPQQHEEIETIPDKETWRVYARGWTGNLKGIIYKSWINTEYPPEEITETIWAIDYGYGTKEASGKTAIIRIDYIKPFTLYLTECCYLSGGAENGIDEHTIKEVLELNGWQNGQPYYSEHDPNMVIAQRKIGMHVLQARKGPNSEFPGIMKIKKFQVYYNANKSPNLHWERLHAKFFTVGDEVTKIVEDTKRYHLLAALRYGVFSHFQTI